jgi:GNAT superfamily N-acetyltransferase
LPSRETKEYELNEVSWWGRWVDDTVWVSKNCYAIFSDTFRGEQFYNHGGFLGVERVPELIVEAVEKEFAKRKRMAPCFMVEEGRPWDKLRASLSSRGYAVGDRMLVMESTPREKGWSAQDSDVKITLVGWRSKGKEIQEWTRTYLRAFYGDQRLGEKVDAIMRRVVRDKKATVMLARVGRDPVGCAALYRSAGGVIGAYCIGTDPSFRGRGVAAAMLDAMRGIAEGERRRLILQTMASDGAEGLYLKAGFKLAYVKDLFTRRSKRVGANDLPSGEAFGVAINRTAAAGATVRFAEVFAGFEAVVAVRRLFGPETDKVISMLKISLDSPRGYLRVDGETGNVIINPEYLRTGHERHLYLDAIHELTHVRQFMEGKELYDRRLAYFDRPTEIEAYQVAVEEAKRIGMDREEIIEYLRVEWVTEEEFQRFVSVMLP